MSSGTGVIPVNDGKKTQTIDDYGSALRQYGERNACSTICSQNSMTGCAVDETGGESNTAQN